MKSYYISGAVILATILSGCKSDPAGPDEGQIPMAGTDKVYVLNEGNFGDATGARLTVYDLKTDSVYKDVVEAANGGFHLGSLGDDIKISDDKAYIAMSGSENIVVVSLKDYRILRNVALPGTTPHDLLIDKVHGKLFVTMLYKAKVLVLDLSTLVVRDSISVGQNPVAMYLSNDRLFICNSGYGNDRTVTVVNAYTNQVERTLVLSDGPSGIDAAPDGTIWVVCSGNAFGNPATGGKFFSINPQTLTVSDSLSFMGNLWGPVRITKNGIAYVLGDAGTFMGGTVHSINLATKSVTENFIGKAYYALEIDQLTGNLYLGDAKNFGSDGQIDVYTSQGAPVRSFPAQKGPGTIVVNR